MDAFCAACGRRAPGWRCSWSYYAQAARHIGKACAAYQDEALRDLPASRIECDEIWSAALTVREARVLAEHGTGR